MTRTTQHATRPAPHAPPIITLLTDFGEADGYAGTMKGVILGIAPQATIVDLSHEIGPQDVGAGAFVLGRAYPYFPPHTVHIAVVDPGVGSARRPLLLVTPRGAFVGPDNGLFSPVLAGEPAAQAYELAAPAYWLPAVSTTFHGRDVFAPSAAHFARGVPATALGRAVLLDSLVRLLERPPVRHGATVSGQIVYVDRFGNAVTNIPAALLATLPSGWPLTVTVGAARVVGMQSTYADAPEGATLALLGSAGLLEIAVRNGHAARRLGLRVGDPVQCTATALDNPPALGL